MIWDSPQKLIRQTAFYLALVSLVMAVGFVLLALFWQQNRDRLVAWDQAIPDYYADSVAEFKQALTTAENPEEKFRIYKSINETLAGHSSLNRYFDLYNQSFDFLIDHYLQQGDHKQALKLANNWMTSQPHNLNAQLKYAQTMSKTDATAAMAFTDKLAARYFDIPSIQLHYLTQLQLSGQTEQAWNSALRLQKHSDKTPQPGFAFYYTDAKSTDLTKITVGQHEYSSHGKQVQFTQTLPAHSLQQFRFDVDGLPTGSIIKNLSIKSSGQKLPIELMHDLKWIGEDLVTIGTDPYLRVLLADTQNPVDYVTYKVSLEVTAKRNNYLHDLVRQINGQYVTESTHTSFKFSPYGNHYASPAISLGQHPAVTIKLDSFSGFKFSELYLIDDQGAHIAANNMTGFSSSDGWWVAAPDSEQSLSFQLPDDVQSQNMHVVMELGSP